MILENMYSLVSLMLMASSFQEVSALFVVTAPKLIYKAKYGDTVQMNCSFPIEDNFNITKLLASWEHIYSSTRANKEILRLYNGKINILNQGNANSNRVTMLMEELKNGTAVLEIKHVKLTDAGVYTCFLQLEGSDYKSITLEVQASYENIYSYTQVSSDGNEISLTCQSLGFPKAEVYWKNNGNNITLPANTSHSLTKDGFYNTSSTIKSETHSIQNYKCVFWNKALNETTEASFGLEENGSLPSLETNVSIIMVVLLLFLFVVLFYLTRKYSFKCFRKKRLKPLVQKKAL
ncbi:programmed cell death 1 ligand 2-like [Spea bombifrons]|uniref:programmed cell death 1 ligand 2-like n=1 Tax=Spea bombifrons TaxID=233779 RepID=UPI00234A48A9|nr:programmed cell death 1 ligand 2-like [Spea bombifrons]